jgi:ABC-type sugar transport system permease subunit
MGTGLATIVPLPAVRGGALVVVAVLIIALVLGLVPAIIVRSKGRPIAAWLIFGALFLLPAVVILAAVAIGLASLVVPR